MLNYVEFHALTRIRTQEMIDEAARNRANESGSVQRVANPHYVGAVIERFARRFAARFAPVRLVTRHST